MAHVPKVMVSSTFRDLKAERDGVRDVIQGQDMLPRMMETDFAIADRGLLGNSRKMVEEADLYLLLISNYRYGQIIPDAELNPNGLSITEREFEWAEARGLPIFVFLMDASVASQRPPAELADDLRHLAKLQSFRKRAQHHCRITTSFRTVPDLREKVVKALSDWRRDNPLPGPSDPVVTQASPEAPTVPPPDRCLGRDADRDTLVAALCAGTAPTAVLVQGAGGIGKTTLTQEAANHPDVIARFGTRRWFVALETATDRDTFDAALLAAIGLDPAAGFASVPRRLAQAPTLLVLDNLETPWERAGPAIEARLGELAAIPGVALLASFRGQAAVGGARWSLRRRVDPLAAAEARALFLDIAGTIATDDPALPELLRELGGVPLAICLTARQAAERGELAGLWAEWQRVGVGLARWQEAGESRLTSVAHSIELSLASPRMTPAARRLFAIVGQVPAGLAAADRDALLRDEGFAAEGRLIAVGLAHHRAGRLDLLPPVRDHARRAHPPAAAEVASWCRYFLGLARDQGGRILEAGGSEALARLTPEVANIEAALRAADGLSLRDDAVAATNGTCRLLLASGLGSIGALRALAEDCRHAGDTRGEAGCLYRAGYVAFGRSDHGAARALNEQARPLFQQVGDVLGEANCICSLGDIELARSDHAAARALYEQARPLFQQVGDVLGEANCIQSLGDIALARRDHAAARALYEQARPLFQQVGAVLGEANCIFSLGDMALRRRDHAAARALFEQARPLYQQVGSVLGEANCIKSLGDIAVARRDHAAARALFEQARPLFQQVGDVLGEANCISAMGDVARAEGDAASAIPPYTQALALYEQLHATQNVALGHEDLAHVTAGAEQAAHVAAACAAWTEMDLPEQVARVKREFG